MFNGPKHRSPFGSVIRERPENGFFGFFVGVSDQGDGHGRIRVREHRDLVAEIAGTFD